MLEGTGPLAEGLRFWARLQAKERKELAKARSYWNREEVQGMPKDSKPPKDVDMLMCMP